MPCGRGEDFADIFKNNCFQGGMLTVELPAADIDFLMGEVKSNPDLEVIVNLPSQTVALADGTWQRDFEIDPFKKYRLMRGLDDISMTLEYEPDILIHETARPDWLPTTG